MFTAVLCFDAATEPMPLTPSCFLFQNLLTHQACNAFAAQCPEKNREAVWHFSMQLQKYAPSVFEKYTTSITVGNKEVILNLYDTAGQEDYDRLRPLSYQNTNLVLICYDVMNPTSYDNVLIKWYPEVSEPITYNQGEATCQQIKGEAYLECSAKYRENVEDVFKEATNIALSAMKKAKRRKKRKRCVIL
nr:rho-related GTP-binding protein RhoF [Pelodiscus sinensis]|eukprot:XP_006136045.1 rho-related GTP-binding protein RhoF [Pelodiscus sinensis]